MLVHVLKVDSTLMVDKTPKKKSSKGIKECVFKHRKLKRLKRVI